MKEQFRNVVKNEIAELKEFGGVLKEGFNPQNLPTRTKVFYGGVGAVFATAVGGAAMLVGVPEAIVTAGLIAGVPLGIGYLAQRTLNRA